MLQDAIAAALPQLRAEAEARMTSTATVRRKTGTTKIDGITVPQWTTVHIGPFRLAGSRNAGASRTHTVGGVEYEVSTRAAHFPVAVATLRDADVLEVLDGDAAGLFFRLIETDFADQQTARRMPVEATTRPEGW